LRACAVSLRLTAGDVLWADGRCHPLLVLAGQSMDRARLTGPAVAYWRELTADSEQILGPGSLETFMVSGCLGEALMAAGQTTEAVSWFQRVLDGRAAVLGPDHPDAIAAKVSLGRALMAVGRPQDAPSGRAAYRHHVRQPGPGRRLPGGRPEPCRRRPTDAQDAGDPGEHHRLILARCGSSPSSCRSPWRRRRGRPGQLP
jgi:hypothetical protein